MMYSGIFAALLTVSEILPFIHPLESNGILHLLFNLVFPKIIGGKKTATTLEPIKEEANENDYQTFPTKIRI